MIVLPHLFSPFFRQFPKSEGKILSGTMIPPLNKAASNSKVSTLLVGDKQCGNIHAFLKIEKKQSPGEYQRETENYEISPFETSSPFEYIIGNLTICQTLILTIFGGIGMTSSFNSSEIISSRQNNTINSIHNSFIVGSCSVGFYFCNFNQSIANNFRGLNGYLLQYYCIHPQ